MHVLHDPLHQTDLPAGCVATIGNFDGLHVGHQEIIRGVTRKAVELGVPSTVITFSPHPLSIVAPDRVPKQILTLAQKEEILTGLGVDAFLIVPFTPDFSRWTAERFVEDFLVKAHHIREVHIGDDFGFGAGRTGNLTRLKQLGQQFGFGVEGVGEVRVRGVRVSSSIVRGAVESGAMRATRLALGRTYYIDGRVATGRRLGRKIGFPTVNVDPANDLFPGSGVYITTSQFESFESTFQSVTNIGVRPTLYENYGITIESHILDFDSNVYGDTVRVYFHELLRRERQFRSALELTNQIRTDSGNARAFFLKHPTNAVLRMQGVTSP